MQTQSRFVIRLLAGAIAAAGGACAFAANPGWNCTAGAGGGWDCRAGAPMPGAPMPGAPAAPAEPEAPAATDAMAPSTVAEPPVHQDAVTPTSTVPPPGGTATAEAVDVEPDQALADNMDWVPRSDLASGADTPQNCGGSYLEPKAETGATTNVAIGTIQASSDESELLRNNEIAHFRGNVRLRQDDRRLRSDQATYFRQENRVDIAGNVQFREPGLLVRAESASVQTEENSAELSDARMVLHREHARGAAEHVSRNTDGSIDLEQGSYTHCEPGDNAWQLVSEAIHLDRDTGQGTARNARLEVVGVPVLYTPYIRFPIDDRRSSGFLWPEFTNSSQNGVDLAAPYYFNLAPNYDATVVPRYLVDRGAMAGGEARYLGQHGFWTASGAFLPDDDVYKDNRWLANLQHAGTLPFGVSTGINYTEVSDTEYFRNLGTSLDIKRATHLGQGANIAWSPGNAWRIKAMTQQFQVLDEQLGEPYKIMPRLSVSRAPVEEPFSASYSMQAEYTAFEHQDKTRLTGQRLYLEPNLGYPMEWQAAYVRPTLGYRAISYSLDDGACSDNLVSGPCRWDDESPEVDAPFASLDAGYFLERSTRWFGRDFLQTLEPRAYYLWSDYADHSGIPNFDSIDLTFSFSQLFRNTRFAGHDRIADTHQASFSLTSRLIDDTSGLELVTASIGRIEYFEDRRVTIANVPGGEIKDSSSAIAAELQVQPDEALSFTSSVMWDPAEDSRNHSAAPRNEPREHGFMVHWSPDDERIVNLSYRYRRDQPTVNPLGVLQYEDIDQVDFSTALPIARNWKILARYQYDFTNDQNLEETAGLEYSSCCWALRMVYQEGLDWDQGKDYGVYVEFVLRGLGGLGRNIDSLLQKSIFGYGEYQTDYRRVD